MLLPCVATSPINPQAKVEMMLDPPKRLIPFLERRPLEPPVACRLHLLALLKKTSETDRYSLTRRKSVITRFPRPFKFSVGVSVLCNFELLSLISKLFASQRRRPNVTQYKLTRLILVPRWQQKFVFEMNLIKRNYWLQKPCLCLVPLSLYPVRMPKLNNIVGGKFSGFPLQ